MVKNRTIENNIEKTNIYFLTCPYSSENLGILDPFDNCYLQLQNLKSTLNNKDFPFFCVSLPSKQKT